MLAICFLSLGSGLGTITQIYALASHTKGSLGPRASLEMVVDIQFCPC
jgi:hypothetical protein